MAWFRRDSATAPIGRLSFEYIRHLTMRRIVFAYAVKLVTRLSLPALYIERCEVLWANPRTFKVTQGHADGANAY
jgi:hypothetical protein